VSFTTNLPSISHKEVTQEKKKSFQIMFTFLENIFDNKIKIYTQDEGVLAHMFAHVHMSGNLLHKKSEKER
jgi:hypothetical protein